MTLSLREPRINTAVENNHDNPGAQTPTQTNGNQQQALRLPPPLSKAHARTHTCAGLNTTACAYGGQSSMSGTSFSLLTHHSSHPQTLLFFLVSAMQSHRQDSTEGPSSEQLAGTEPAESLPQLDRDCTPPGSALPGTYLKCLTQLDLFTLLPSFLPGGH